MWLSNQLSLSYLCYSVALSIVSKAYCSRNSGIPIATMSTWLLMSDIASTAELCTMYGESPPAIAL